MGLSNDLISQFAKITKDTSKTKSESTVYGTTVEYEGSIYVRLDGSELLTPVSTTTDMKPGERVIVLIKNHSATVTGNVSSPSARTDDVKEVKNKTEELGNQISEFEIIVADKVSTSELEAERGRIDELVSDNVIIREKLTAAEADIGNLEADNVIINEKLIANEAIINDLEVKKLDAEQADIKYATVENLEATNADLYNLEATYAEFEVATINKLNAHDASIENLEVKKLDAEQADLKYANIDFANIGEAAIENFYAKSGVIQDVVISDGQVTGTLVGVTIKGDLIEGGTVVADKLVIKGEDGLYYKLNTDGESVSSEQTEYNSLSGTIITAKSVTAEKIAVDDLVAFDATIGGFKINDHSIYSGVKESVNNTTRGIYFGSDAQFAIGDSSQYLKYFKDTDGNYKLEIFAKSITIGTSGKSVEDSIDDLQNETQTLKETTITNTVEEFYNSNSPTELTGGSWSTSQPTWTEGTYIWRRTLVTYGDGSTEYTPSETGVCITGNTGPQGPQGAQGIQGIQGEKGEQGIPGQTGESGKTSYFHIKYSSVANPTSSSQMTETPSTYIGTYVDFDSTDSTDPSKYTWSRFEGAQGEKGDQGIAGTNGANGKTSYLHIAYANSSDGSSGFSVSDSSGKSYIGQYTDFNQNDSTDYTKYSWTKIKGETGAAGADGKTSYFHIKYSSVSNPTSSSQMTETPSEYIGTYVDYTAADSTDPSKYTWSRFQGLQGETGEQGIPGTNGENGKTSYLHIKYSNDGGSSFTSNNGETPGDYIGQYADFTQSDSTNVSDYTWTKIKGETGDSGKGVSKSEVYYYLSTSNTTQTGGSWSTTVPDWVDGRYYWQKIKTTYTDGTTAESKPVCITGAKGSTGESGSDGRSVSSITTEFYLSTSKTTQTGGSWVTTMPEWVSGKYLWTRSKIVYSNPSGTEYTEPTCDSSWEAVNEIQVGGRNYIRNSNFVSELFNWSADSGDVYIESNNDISYLKFIPSGGNKLIMYGVSDFWNKDQEYSYSFIAKKANSVIRISDFLVEGSSYRSMVIDSVSENAITINCTNTPSFSYFPIDLTEELISGVTYNVSYTCSGKQYSVLIDEASDSSFNNITKSSGSSVTVSSGKFYRLKIYGNNTSAASTESYTNTYTNISLLPENKSVSITPSRSIVDFGDAHTLTETWTSYSGCIKSTDTATGGTLSISADNVGVPILITKLKLEIGNKATDWSPAPEDVDSAIETKGEELGQVIIEQTESAKEAANAYTDESLKGYVDNDTFVTVEKDINARLDVIDENVTINIESVTKQITAVNDELQEKYNVMVKYFEFGENGLIIGLTDSPYKSVMDNDRYSMVKNDVEVLWFDGDGKGHIPELTLIKEFNLFGLLFDKDESNNINAEYAGEVDSFLLSIIQHPQDASVSVGETAIFNVYATGYNLSYQWQYMRSGSTTWSDSTKDEAKTKKFTITPSNTSVNGQKIRCKITDGYENIVYSDVAIITVTE